MSEKVVEVSMCPSCGFPAYAGHGPNCQKEKTGKEVNLENIDTAGRKDASETELFAFDKKLYEIAKKVISEENESATPSQVEFAHRYLDALLYEKNEEEIGADRARFEKYVDVSMSEQLKDYIFSGKASLFKEYDEKMGINDSNRNAFNIKVLDLSKKTNGTWKESEWGKETKNPTQFVIDRNTIYIPKEEAVQILHGEKSSSENTLVHEYRHTQRKFASENDRLLRIFDESATNVGMGYVQIQVLLDTLFLTTSDMRFSRVRKAYDSNDEKEKNNILQTVEKDFSSFGFLLLSSRPSSEHSGDHDGLNNAPFEIDLDIDCSGNKKLQFLEEMLRFRARVDSNWLQIFKDNIKQFTGREFRRLEVIKANWLKDYFKNIDSSKAEQAKSMFTAIEEVIAEGIAKGEESFYTSPLPRKNNSR